jgi:hypothetical protein
VPDPNTETLFEFWAAMSEAQHLEYACENLKVLLAGRESGQLWNGTAQEAEELFKSYSGNRNLGTSLKAICISIDLPKNTDLFDGLSKKRNWLAHDFIREWESSQSKELEFERLRCTKLELSEALQRVNTVSQLLVSFGEQHSDQVADQEIHGDGY